MFATFRFCLGPPWNSFVLTVREYPVTLYRPVLSPFCVFPFFKCFKFVLFKFSYAVLTVGPQAAKNL